MLKRTFAIIIGVSISSIVMAADMKSRIQEWTTDEGARVLFIEAPEIPMVDFIISMDAGSFREDKNYGLASMTSQMMTLGTKDKDE
ncbi:MAG: M16 family metallopeptidase, partial [Wohlfahrtiimonas sp.]